MSKYFTTKKITYMAVFTALVALATAFLSIPNGIGYTNLGETFIFVAGSFFDPFFAFIVSGLGSAIADMSLGYFIYAIPTFIIKGLEGFLVSILVKTLLKKCNELISILLSFLLGALIMVFGYFITNTLLYSFYEATIAITNDLIQGGINLVLGITLTIVLAKIGLFNKVSNSKLLEKCNEKHTNNK
ncbi:MAG: ECF transporter S component [Clostridiales bacterium]|nr:ECF transporter S component [Clostridiales bacterium]